MERLVDNLLQALLPDRCIHPFRRRTDAALESYQRPTRAVNTLLGLADVLLVFGRRIRLEQLGGSVLLQGAVPAAAQAHKAVTAADSSN